jgi:hypothetical protein
VFTANIPNMVYRTAAHFGRPSLRRQHSRSQCGRPHVRSDASELPNAQGAGLVALALIAPKPRHAHRRAQLPRLCLLLTRNREPTLETVITT